MLATVNPFSCGITTTTEAGDALNLRMEEYDLALREATPPTFS